MRKKNPNPQRAVNARTVLKGEEEEKEAPVVVCVQIPPDDDDDVFVVVEEEEDDDDDEMDEHIQREEADFRKGAKRKRTQQHECDVCEKGFESPSSLAIHMRIHTNEKPYECHVCEKRYRHAHSLKHHMRTQH